MSATLLEYANDQNVRHVLGISGGKDSAALAIYIRQRYPKIHDRIEYFFTDTGAELPEVYQFLDKLEAFLGKEIVRLNSGKTFEEWLEGHNKFLPSPKQRWCTRAMKIKPFEEFIGNDPVISYVGIRADEDREGYISQKDTIKPVFPFIEDGIVRADVFQILEDTVGIPEYYQWRSRSGCYFCFFQRQDEWLGLKEHHPELFEKAKEFENMERQKYDWKDGEVAIPNTGYTWSSQGTIDEAVVRAEKARAKKRLQEDGVIGSSKATERWQDIFKREDDLDADEQACGICSL